MTTTTQQQAANQPPAPARQISSSKAQSIKSAGSTGKQSKSQSKKGTQKLYGLLHYTEN